MIGWLLLAVIFVSGIADVSRAQGSSGPCQELSDCRFYTCLNDRLGCSKDDYPLAYGHRYCHRSNVNRHLFNSQGRQWLSDVQQCLMSQIKNSDVFTNPQDHSDPCGEVGDVAYDSHPNCYTSNGFCDVIIGSDDCTNINGLWNTVEPPQQIFSRNIGNFFKQVYTIASTCRESVLFRSVECGATNVYNGLVVAIQTLLKDCSDSTNNRLDMVFVMDASGSIGAENFASMKTYVANVIRGLNENVRVGIVRYSSSASIILSLTPVSDPESLASTVESIYYTMGGTNTAAGIALAQSMFEQDRCTGVIKAISVLTDGQSDNVHSTTRAANNAKASDIQLYASGIGSGPDQDELQSIASSPPSDYLIPIANFSSAAFNNRIGTQQRSACKTPLVSGVGECTTERRLGQYDASYYEHRVPPEGFTFSASVMGEAGIYASFTERNPNPLTADIQTRGSGQIRLFVSQPGESNRKKRQEATTVSVYVAVISLGEGNTTVNVSSDVGDITNFDILGGPTNQTVLLGETVNFTCAASGTGILIFMLSHETQGILTVNEEVGLNADITNSTLIVANTSVGSSGIYWCNVTGEGKNIRSHSGVLTVQVPGPKVIITKAPDDIIYAGDNVTLICHIEADSINVANLSVSIILEGPDGVIANDTHDLDDDLSVTILNYSATLMSVKPSNDSEIYTCKAVYTLKDDIPHVTFEESSNLVVINVIVPDPCLSKPCDLNADCERQGEMSSEFDCTCRKPFTGNGLTCTSRTKNKSITVGATFGGTLLCILIGFMVGNIIHS